MYKKNKVLALDLATRTGWCFEDHRYLAYGEWDLSFKKDESPGMRIVRFMSKLTELLDGVKPDIIAYELPTGKYITPIKTESELIGVLKLTAEQRGIEYKGYSPSEIKKWATGKGNANKALMIAAAEGRYGIANTTDNEADAIHLCKMVRESLGYSFK